MNILYDVWQATADMLLSVVPFLLNNKPQFWVFTTETRPVFHHNIDIFPLIPAVVAGVGLFKSHKNIQNKEQQ